MRAGALASALCAAALLGGCTTSTAIDRGGANPVAGWNAGTRALAANSWLYAQLAINAYEDHEAFILPGDVVQRTPTLGNDDIGYAYVIFDRFDGDELVETIIAYRGTEPGFDDFVLGSVLGGHHDRGLATAMAVYEQMQAPQYAQTSLSLTGHSLGGGVAMEVSEQPLGEDGEGRARIVAFNSAPRFGALDSETDRLSIVERGDWLGFLRQFGNRPSEAYSLDCQPGFSPGRDHSMRDLAECLTWIAAYDDPEAGLSLAQNPLIGRPVSQTSPERPRVPAEIGDGVPINPHSNDEDIAYRLRQRLTASPVLFPWYRSRVGWRVHVDRLEGDGRLSAYWVLNGVEQSRIVLTCEEPSSIESCIDLIVSGGEAMVVDFYSRPER
ncbi:hypothetical protein [Aurantiacibacter sp. D1-12]|uniref:hypothetical protein n=1 Tax=Aurantiacibacter sp. D1-12 TaxID=2993658 RepID=UPI00237C572F|nr:hypothetical protein [Aurantiacibacter sp. D1-12]MDE1467908.1 hypothetical protein [Aurantiacibacter sp. D1-12]